MGRSTKPWWPSARPSSVCGSSNSFIFSIRSYKKRAQGVSSNLYTHQLRLEDRTLDQSTALCPNCYCLPRGERGRGNIKVHSHKERRFPSPTCGKPFAATKNPPPYRLHKPVQLMTIVLTLLAHGCPLQAVVAASGLDERTVSDWQDKAGRHAQRFHEL